MDVPVGEMLLEGVKLMVIGMSIVFGFLLLLVGMLFGMSRLASRLAPAPMVAVVPGTAKSPGAEESRIAAIAAAVGYYRRRHRG